MTADEKTTWKLNEVYSLVTITDMMPRPVIRERDESTIFPRKPKARWKTIETGVQCQGTATIVAPVVDLLPSCLRV